MVHSSTMFKGLVRVSGVGITCTALFGGVRGADAGTFSYAPVGSYSIPTTPFGSPAPFDVLADGRLITIATDGRVSVQSAANSSDYTVVGQVAPAVTGPFGAAFIRVSPDGGTLAIGNNLGGAEGRVSFVSITSLTPGVDAPASTVLAGNFDANWSDSNTLYVSGQLSGSGGGGGSGGAGVSRITLSSLAADAVVTGIAGFSGGVVTSATHLFTANGFATGSPPSSGTGQVRAFPLSAVTAAAASGTPIDFESSGIPVADALSGASLGFDPLGNMLIGGGDFSMPDLGYAAVVDGAAIAAALLGGPLAPDSAEQRLIPGAGGSFSFPIAEFNLTLNELLIADGGTVYRYAVPAPGAAAGGLAVGLLAARRRRRA